MINGRPEHIFESTVRFDTALNVRARECYERYLEYRFGPWDDLRASQQTSWIDFFERNDGNITWHK